MGALDALWHLSNFLAPAFGVGLAAAWLAKVFWWRELKGVSGWRMAAWAVPASALVLIGGLLWHGQDGKMSTYGAMVVVCALALWWAGWKERR
ncbi:hypothetical protein LRS03_12880 [Rhizobacter sp. J219]|jgi:hypothetical protein|uniref:hypothetical protein n=1 Tax=Rhizobacter sp. J219 TaxID=2898430 RepID=UPI002150D777|nr:hypothetical protein [Rhizobacter sp. J219]MCR5883702.1 hypothetical protein [Rhizobacter sp. J219]